MKRITYILLAAAATLACTKNEIAYEQTNEIGFTAVAGNMTKAVVDGTTYPTGLNMYVFAWTTDYAPTATQNSPNYINNGEFAYKEEKSGTKVWGGSPQKYYWPNTKKLHFAGCSKSGNLDDPQTVAVEGPKPVYNCLTDELTITGYSPLYGTAAGANDLMWFTSAEHSNAPADGYGKDTPYVPVNMYHTCSWITFIVKGDDATKDYKVTEMKMIEIDQTANVTCDPDPEEEIPTIYWTENTQKEHTSNYPTEYEILTDQSNDDDVTIGNVGINVETKKDTDEEKNKGGNIVVIPQKPGRLELTYTYSSSASQSITEVYSAAKNNALNLKLNTDNTLNWEPGVHYIYTLTIKANEILIAPTPKPWGDPTNGNITVE